jgi:hypothetical protein
MSTRVASVVLGLKLLLCLRLRFGLGCGMVQHNEVVSRARALLALPHTFADRPPTWLPTLLDANMDALLAGAPSPDFGYLCFAPEAAEAMHWTPFQVRARPLER